MRTSVVEELQERLSGYVGAIGEDLKVGLEAGLDLLEQIVADTVVTPAG